MNEGVEAFKNLSDADWLIGVKRIEANLQRQHSYLLSRLRSMKKERYHLSLVRKQRPHLQQPETPLS